MKRGGDGRSQCNCKYSMDDIYLGLRYNSRLGRNVAWNGS
jgi:hypothetical protein